MQRNWRSRRTRAIVRISAVLTLSLVVGLTLLLTRALASAGATPLGESERLAVKHRFAPSREVLDGTVVLPPPTATPTRSEVLILTGAFESLRSPSSDSSSARGASRAEFSFCHGGGRLRITPLGPMAWRWRAVVRSSRAVIPLESSPRVGVSRNSAQVLSQSALGCADPTLSYDLELEEGWTTVELFAPTSEAGRRAAVLIDDGAPDGRTAIAAGKRDALVACLATRLQRPGETLSLFVRGAGPICASSRGYDASMPREVELLTARVRWADGSEEDASEIASSPPHDNTARRVSFAHAKPGEATIVLQGRVKGRDGRWRPRTIHSLTAVGDGTAVDGAPLVRRASPSEEWLTLEVPVKVGLSNATVLFSACELWACRRESARPLGWVGGLAEVASSRVAVQVHRDHCALQEDEVLECRALRLHSRDGFVLLDLVERATPTCEVDLSLRQDGGETAPTQSCGDGADRSVAIATIPHEPEDATHATFTPSAGAHALVLTHGYCADENRWPTAHFGSDAWFYENPLQSLSHDAFARDLRAQAAPFKSYGLVAHSQGGCAALHLYAFYWSGLDWAGPGRLIQTVGTPFQGTALAGNLAALAEVFDGQCGSNYDLTYDGAAAWLSTVPLAARARVYTATTTFTDHWWSYDACSGVTDLFLTDPEDGVTESFSGHIIGATSMGLTEGWCHTTGMNEPEQCSDGARNALLNAQGAR